MSDSCGYIALDHQGKRIIAAFRGTYSVANTIVDLTTIPQEYVPYPGDPDEDPEEPPGSNSSRHHLLSWPWRWFRKAGDRLSASSSSLDLGEESHRKGEDRPEGPRCNNCTVHMGFFSCWKNTRRFIIPLLTHLHDLYPTYRLHLVGHSLGGAVAALAGLETDILGWNPTVTTFGEPRIGNIGLNQYLDEIFDLKNTNNSSRFRRMTHMNDPVPLLPLSEWGFYMHAGEIYISKAELQPRVSDLRLCDGDQDVNCIFGAEAEAPFAPAPGNGADGGDGGDEIDDVAEVTEEMEVQMRTRWGLPARYRMWQLFFAHREYFWRLGLCVPGGDPADWGRRYDNFTGGIDEP
jgi:pimeloyl-ACP methyl ester carboxylesterase